MATAYSSSVLSARLLPTSFSRSLSSAASISSGVQPFVTTTLYRSCRPLVTQAASQEEPLEDITTRKFQIPGFRRVKKVEQVEAEGASSSDASAVSRRQTMIGAVAGMIAAAGAATGVSQAEAGEGSEFQTAPSGLGFKETAEGTGAEPVKGQLIKAHYTGRLESTGKVFDSSYTRGKPLTFRIGAGEVIKGWDQGILGAEGIPPMKAGGKRVLRIPAALGYGARGAGCRGGVCAIPPDSTLIFDVEFVGKASG